MHFIGEVPTVCGARARTGPEWGRWPPGHAVERGRVFIALHDVVSELDRIRSCSLPELQSNLDAAESVEESRP